MTEKKEEKTEKLGYTGGNAEDRKKYMKKNKDVRVSEIVFSVINDIKTNKRICLEML